MKLLKKFLCLGLLVTLSFGVAGCDDIIYDDKYEENEFGESDSFGAVRLTYTNAELFINSNDDLALKVVFNVRNTGQQPITFNDYLTVEAYQNNRELVLDQNNPYTGSENETIPAGSSLEVTQSFVLENSTGQVDVNVYEVNYTTGDDMTFEVNPNRLAKP